MGRLVDWVHQFSKSTSFNLSKRLPASSQPFDVTFQDAFITMNKYVDVNEIKEKQSPVSEIDFVNTIMMLRVDCAHTTPLRRVF